MSKIKIGDDVFETSELPSNEQVLVKNLRAVISSIQEDQNTSVIFQKAKSALLLELKSGILKVKTGLDFGAS
jgi:hypothetical protein